MVDGENSVCRGRWVATLATTCELCDLGVEEGAAMYPHRLEGKRYKWAHLECVLKKEGSLPVPPECKHWKFLGRCAMGGKGCFFRHEGPESSPALAEPGKPLSGWRSARLVKSGRAFAFRRFLLQVFGSAPLCALDVAGGKGELGFELQNLNEWKVAVVDPRDKLDTSDFRKKWQHGLYTRNQHWSSLSPGWSADKEPTDPIHFPVLFEDCWLNWLEFDGLDDSELPVEIQREWDDLKQRSAGTQYWRKPEVESDEDLEISTDTQHPPLSKIVTFMKNCDVLLGMHPDKPTEALIDFALATNKSFAVVPCCVFSKAFPSRRLKDGRPVVTHAEFCDYLCEKNPKIKRAQLEFEGRNDVLYWVDDTKAVKKEEISMSSTTQALPYWRATYTADLPKRGYSIN